MNKIRNIQNINTVSVIGLMISATALAILLAATAVGCDNGTTTSGNEPGNQWIDVDNDGYDDNTDLDRDGNPRPPIEPGLEPVGPAGISAPGRLTNQIRTCSYFESSISALETQNTKIADQFNKYCENTNLKNAVADNCSYMDTAFNGNAGNIFIDGDDGVKVGTRAISNNISAITAGIPEGKRDMFNLFVCAYRTKGYLGNRMQESNGVMAENQNDLNGFYAQLGATEANFGAKFNAFMDGIAVDLNIDRALLTSLLNQAVSMEQFYGLVDDAKARGFAPMGNASSVAGYKPSTQARNNAYIHSFFENGQTQDHDNCKPTE